MPTNLTHLSKFLSLILRHKPEQIGLTLDENGWASVQEFISKANAAGFAYTPELLDEIVDTNNKKRFAFNADKSRIRASQGHSIDVELDLPPVEPPEFLYHGTVEKFLSSILKEGLQKMQRQHVHLSKDTETATNVAARRGKPVTLTILARQMHAEGHLFYLSANAVWLTDQVLPKFIVK